MTRVTAAPLPAAVPAAPASVQTPADPAGVSGPVAAAWVDADAKVSFTPPSGWVRAPQSALNPPSSWTDPVLELVRFQLRIGDPSLYAQPLPLTSGILQDAGAVISVGLAREGSDVAAIDLDPRLGDASGRIPGFLTMDEEATYEGLHTLARYFVARDTERRIVVRAVAAADDWPGFAPTVLAALASVRADPSGPNAPAAAPQVAPAPVVEEAPAAPQVSIDTTLEARNVILARAASMLGVAYVWGGNSPAWGLDCSAYVSRAWGVGRHTTDSMWDVASPIAKDDLRPGDAMNLTMGRDPQGYGHIRLFETWANAAHTLVWVYEETPPRAVHRVVAYDARYQPIRLDGLSGAGVATVVPAPLASEAPRGFVPSAPRQVQTARPRQTPLPFTPRPTDRRFPSPTPAPRVVTPTVQRTFAPTSPPRTVAPTPAPRDVTATPTPTLDPRPATAPPRSPSPTVRPTIRVSSSPTAATRRGR